MLYTDRYTESSLYGISYQKVDGRQIRKISGQAAARDTSDEDDDDEDDDEEAPAATGDATQATPVQPDSPMTPPAAAQTAPSTGLTSEQLTKLTDSLTDQMTQRLTVIVMIEMQTFSDRVIQRLDTGLAQIDKAIEKLSRS